MYINIYSMFRQRWSLLINLPLPILQHSMYLPLLFSTHFGWFVQYFISLSSAKPNISSRFSTSLRSCRWWDCSIKYSQNRSTNHSWWYTFLELLENLVRFFSTLLNRIFIFYVKLCEYSKRIDFVLGAEIFFPDAEARREHLLSLVDQVMEEKKAVSVGYTFESLCRFFSNRDASGLLGLPDVMPCVSTVTFQVCRLLHCTPAYLHYIFVTQRSVGCLSWRTVFRTKYLIVI